MRGVVEMWQIGVSWWRWLLGLVQWWVVVWVCDLCRGGGSTDVGCGHLADRGVEHVWGAGDVVDRCFVVVLVAGFGTVVGCGLGMRYVSWWWVYRRGTWAFGRSWC